MFFDPRRRRGERKEKEERPPWLTQTRRGEGNYFVDPLYGSLGRKKKGKERKETGLLIGVSDSLDGGRRERKREKCAGSKSGSNKAISPGKKKKGRERGCNLGTGLSSKRKKKNHRQHLKEFFLTPRQKKKKRKQGWEEKGKRRRSMLETAAVPREKGKKKGTCLWRPAEGKRRFD